MTPSNNSSDPTRVDVLIVGAGPTGLALANTVKRADMSLMIVDKLASGLNTSRAAVIHAHTLDVLEDLGVSERLVQKGTKLSRFTIRDRDRALVKLRFDSLPTRYPHLLMLPQDITETVLADALVEAGGRVHRGYAVESLSQDADGVTASILSDGAKQTVHAKYVVGADGMHSIVRETAGIGFSGSAYQESFILADVDMEWGQGREEVALFFSTAGLVVVAPLPSGSYRIVATLDNAPEKPGVADIQALLDSRGTTDRGGTVARVHWSSRFRLQHRVADHYRKGPFFLIGDAAHVHSPAGGQGMNTGIVDACVLGRLLSDVLSGRKPESHLDVYETLRRPAAKKVLGLTGRLTHMAILKSAPQRVLRNAFLATINQLPAVRRVLEMNLSGLSRSAAAQIPR